LKRLLIVAGILLSLVAGCTREEDYTEPESFAFVVYPGARYLGQISEVFKQAHKVSKPDQEPPPVAVYDTDAPLDEVAAFYAKAYGYGTVAAQGGAGSSVKAYFRSGDLAADSRGGADLMKQLGLNTDVTKAVGSYRAAEIQAKTNRPRVTIQRPYFDVTTSQVVDRTLILMAR
jgi:hypothetical protein